MSQVSLKTQTPSLEYAHRLSKDPNEVPELTIFEKIAQIFCCCCCTPKQTPVNPPQEMKSYDLMGFRDSGVDEFRHKVWPPTRRSSIDAPSYSDPHSPRSQTATTLNLPNDTSSEPLSPSGELEQDEIFVV